MIELFKQAMEAHFRVRVRLKGERDNIHVGTVCGFDQVGIILKADGNEFLAIPYTAVLYVRQL